jgi:hypothetical protein
MDPESDFKETPSTEVVIRGLPDDTNQDLQVDENNSSEALIKKKPTLFLKYIENPDYSWMQRLLRLQKIHILKVNQTQYEVISPGTQCQEMYSIMVCLLYVWLCICVIMYIMCVYKQLLSSQIF